MKVAIIKRREDRNNAEAAIKMCDGLSGLEPGAKVLIKPNLVFGDDIKNTPPFGVVTTARLTDETVRVLKNRGISDITIGEGAIISKEARINTTRTARYAGVDKVVKRHKLKFIDFDRDEFQDVEFEGARYKVAKAALEADFIVNLPVLKTHAQTVVSLGLKNLKGCLKFSSKKSFHNHGLDSPIAYLGKLLAPGLTIIDGTYAMEHGPITGKAHRWDLLAASNDPLAADIAGAALLGKDPGSIAHIKAFAELIGQSADPAAIEVAGEKIEDHAKDLPWEFELEKYFNKFGLTGYTVTYGVSPETICSPCGSHLMLAQLMFAKDNPGLEHEGVEILVGKHARPKTDAPVKLLFGKCAIAANKDVEGAKEVRGCPPNIAFPFWKLMDVSLPKNKVNQKMYVRVAKLLARNAGLYSENFHLWEGYEGPEFDLKHFRL